MNSINKKLLTFALCEYYIRLINMLFPVSFDGSSEIDFDNGEMVVHTGTTSQHEFRKTSINMNPTQSKLCFKDEWNRHYWCSGHYINGVMDSCMFVSRVVVLNYRRGNLKKYACGADEVNIETYTYSSGRKNGQRVSDAVERNLREHCVHDMTDI